MKLILIICFIALAFPAWGTVYEVGPGKTYDRIIDIATYNLSAGDIIKVYYKSTPYREKFLLHGVGTAAQPIMLIGIADAQGRKPILDGQNAVSSTAIKYYNEDRQIIKVGQNNTHLSDHIIIDGFALRNANHHNTYTDDGGTTRSYGINACGVRPEYATNITLRNCEITNNGNGLFNGVGAPQHFIVEHCYIYNNGQVTPDDYHQHNIYMGSGGAGSKITIQYCRFGDMANDGQQCKFRTETVVFRYNWVSGGKNSQLDIVEATSNGQADAFVYGNVIIKPAITNNARMVHFGGDQSGSVRNGTLYFYNNTCIIHSTNSTTSLFQVSRSGANAVVSNNIFYKTSDTTLKTWRSYANISGSNNYLPPGSTYADVFSGNILGTDPGFTDVGAEDFSLKSASSCVDKGMSAARPGYSLSNQYIKHLRYQSRPLAGVLDLGAFEREGYYIFHGSDFNGDNRADIAIYRPSNGRWCIRGQASIAWGASGDVPVPGDYNGDGTTDIAIYRPSNGRWCIRGQASIPYGANGDVPVPADYNGDGTTDIAIYRPSTGRWCVRGQASIPWGAAGDIPVPADYNGDGTADIAVYRPTNGRWCIRGQASIPWGAAGDVPVPADYNGDGSIDIAVYRSTNGRWCVRGNPSTPWGAVGDVPVPADFDGDGSADIAIFRPSKGIWAVKGDTSILYGTATDIPLITHY
ncbi:MAG: hypothetical protein GY765_04460 [bacterium]|nr:hypothetical protein [bacterium]